jgi:hypothetical protein
LAVPDAAALEPDRQTADLGLNLSPQGPPL